MDRAVGIAKSSPETIASITADAQHLPKSRLLAVEHSSPPEMSTGASKKASPSPPAGKGDGSPKSPAKSEQSDSPTDPKSSTSVPPVDSNGQRRESSSKAMDPPGKSMRFTSNLDFYDNDPDMTKPAWNNDQSYGKRREPSSKAVDSLPSPKSPTEPKSPTPVPPADSNGHSRESSSKATDPEMTKPPLFYGSKPLDDNKTYLNAVKHAFSIKESFSKKPWRCEKRSRHQYSAHREIRGDGNGFYRAFMFGYMEHILESKDIAEVARLKESIEECKMTMKKMEYRFDSSTFDDTVEKLNSLISSTDVSIRPTDLMQRACVPEVSDSMGKFLRYVTAAEIRKRNYVFDAFVGNCEKETEKYCETYVLPLGVEGDELHIMALCSALGVPVRVVHLDRYGFDSKVFYKIYATLPPPEAYFESFTEGTDSPGTDHIQPRFTLAFRPGHFDILYPK